MKNQQSLVKLIAGGFLLSIFSITACQKDASESKPDTEETANLTMSSEDDAVVDLVFSEIHEQELGMMEDIGLPDIGLNDLEIGMDTAGRCVKVIVTPREPFAFPKTVIFDYGTGCVGRDGKRRTGKMITTYSAPMVKPGATAVTRFEDYSVNGIKVFGRHTTKNNSTSSVRIFTRTVNDGKLIFPAGGVVIWNATHTNKQVAGLGTPGFPLDDEFEITGGAKGVSERGNKRIEWSRVIAEPLHKAFKCRWIDKGVVHITRGDNRAILNYGDGTCDNKAVIIVNGQRKEITL
jgi:hypothetical protein